MQRNKRTKRSNSEVIDICNKTDGLKTAKINCIFDNFKYLIDEKIIPISEMKTLYFDTADLTFESLIEYYRNNGNFPELFNSLCIEPTKSNQLELRDRLVSASTLNLLSDSSDEIKIKTAKRILNRNNFNTIVESDNMRINSILSSINIYHSFLNQKCFDSIKYPIYEKLKGNIK